MHKYQIGFGWEMVDATNDRLFTAFARATKVSLWDAATRAWVTGKITGIRMECGHSRNGLPHSFLVSMDAVDHEVYIRTAV